MRSHALTVRTIAQLWQAALTALFWSTMLLVLALTCTVALATILFVAIPLEIVRMLWRKVVSTQWKATR